jgi:cAMP and cAMP-inhibited cGMP 3',5'-cyclic phosphodiesterase 10
MERHHVNHCMTILNSNNGSVNILANLTQEDYKTALDMIEASILATDLALFFGTKKKISEIMIMGSFDNTITEHHNLLRGVIMTCCDLTSMYKPFEGARHTANSVYEEFFQQGDQEKSLNIPYTSELTDRSKQSEIPRMQVGFYNFVVIPAFESLYSILGEPVKNLLVACKENKVTYFLIKGGMGAIAKERRTVYLSLRWTGKQDEESNSAKVHETSYARRYRYKH